MTVQIEGSDATRAHDQIRPRGRSRSVPSVRQGRPGPAASGSPSAGRLRPENPVFLGLDFGTSAVKALLVDGEQNRRWQSQQCRSPCSARRPDTASRTRRPGGRRRSTPSTRSGATMPPRCPLLRASACPARCTARCCSTTAGGVLRPAILWNDVRSTAECAELEAAVPPTAAGDRQYRHARVHRAQTAVGTQARTAGVCPGAHRLAAESLYPLSPDRGDDRGNVGRVRHALARRRRPRLVGRQCCRPPGCRARQCLGWSRAIRRRPGRSTGTGGALAYGATARCWREAQGTMPRARWGCRRSDPATRSFRLAHPACCSPHRPVPALSASGCARLLPCFAGAWHQMGVTLSAAASLAWWAGVTGRTEADLLAEVGHAGVPQPGAVPALPRRRANAA